MNRSRWILHLCGAVISLVLAASPRPCAAAQPPETTTKAPEPDAVTPDPDAAQNAAATEKEALVKKLDEYRTKLEKAQEDRAVKAETDAASVRSGKLIQYGITAGIGPVMHVPLHNGKGASTPAVGVMPYIMLHPAYWTNRPQQNRYCANVWAGKQTHADASKATDGDAKQRAKRRAESLFAAILVDPQIALEILVQSVPRNNVEARVHALMRDLRTVLQRPTIPESVTSLSGPARRNVRVARNARTTDAHIAEDFPTLTNCPPSDVDMRLHKKLCEIGPRSKNREDMLTVAVATNLVQELKEELESKYRRAKLSDDLEDAADQLLALQSTTLEELKAELDAPRFSLYSGANSGRADLSGLTEADLSLAKKIVMARAAGKDEVDVGDQHVSVDAAEEALIFELQVHTVGWMSEVPAKCGTRRFVGFWLGYPLKFTATMPTQVGESGTILRRRLAVTEIIAGGFGISPSAYLSILVGFSIGQTNIPPADNDRELVGTFVLGLGGNLDLFTLLRK